MYHFSVTIHGDFDEVVALARTALADHGFGVLTEIDVAATLKAKLDVDRDRYLILGACNPPYAHQALEADPAIGVLLPCNVVVRQLEGDGVMVDFMNPEAVLHLVGKPGIDRVAGEVRTRLEMVRDAIATAH
ncbi:MAG: DUF302 domain-containing protein [Acidimicrobiia bacterium]|jgi:uncharacterized protein (DUF302 family)